MSKTKDEMSTGEVKSLSNGNGVDFVFNETSVDLVFSEKTPLLHNISAFLDCLPADTESVQIVIYAFNSSYEEYNDATKTLAEHEVWYNLPVSDRLDLLSAAVDNLIDSASAVVATGGSLDDSENDETAAELKKFKTNVRAVARSFSSCIECVDYSSYVEDLLLDLHRKLIGLGNPTLFRTSMEIFRKKMPETMNSIEWKLFSGSNKSSKQTSVGRVITLNSPKGPNEQAPNEQASEPKD